MPTIHKVLARLEEKIDSLAVRVSCLEEKMIPAVQPSTSIFGAKIDDILADAGIGDGDVSSMTDEQLLDIAGIGPAALKAIRKVQNA